MKYRKTLINVNKSNCFEIYNFLLFNFDNSKDSQYGFK